MRITPTTKINQLLSRVIGTVDYKGQGTLHPIDEHVCNPFCLFDEAATITRKDTPPFGVHPHAGAMILTICLSGSLKNITYVKGKEQKTIHGKNDDSPFLVALNAGRGAVHDEHTASDNPTKLLQIVWMTGDDQSKAEMFSDEEPTIITQENDETKIMLCVGSFRGHDAVIQCKQDASVTVLLVTIPPGGKFETDEFANRDGGGNAFIYNVNYEEYNETIEVNDEEVHISHLVDMEFNVGTINIVNKEKNDKAATVLIGFGKPLEKVWTKLLMHNGFIFAQSQEDAEDKLEEFERDGVSKFGLRSSPNCFCV